MKWLKWLVAGALGASVGAAIWTLVAWKTGYEIGWIAWGIGGLTGLGVRLAAKEHVGPQPGVLAVAIAVVAVLGGKYATAHLAVLDVFNQGEIKTATITDEDLIITIADEVAGEFEAAGKPLEWPEGMSVENAGSQEDYPPDVWLEATQRFAAVPAAERQARQEEMKARMDDFMAAMQTQLRDQIFRASFDLFDILWLILAVLSAFRIGSGQSRQPAPAPEGSG